MGPVNNLSLCFHPKEFNLVTSVSFFIVPSALALLAFILFASTYIEMIPIANFFCHYSENNQMEKLGE